MASDKKLRMELEEMRQQIKRHQEQERRGDKRRLTDEEYSRKVAKYEEVIAQLQKNVTAHKQEEETLLNEMEVTGQAFEDMQEQNIRLLQQLREKDDANFKLISERIKSNAIQKMLKEEKDVLSEQINAMQVSVSGIFVFYSLIHLCHRAKSTPRIKWYASSKRRSAYSRTIYPHWRRSSACGRMQWTITSGKQLRVHRRQTISRCISTSM